MKLKLQTPSWDVIATGHWNGRYDICVCSMTPSKARAEVFDFPVEYYQSPAVIVVNAKDQNIVTGKDLSGKKVGVISASTYEAYLNRDLLIEGAEDKPLSYPFESVQVAPYDNETVAFQDLALGTGVRLDAMVTNLVTAREHIVFSRLTDWHWFSRRNAYQLSPRHCGSELARDSGPPGTPCVTVQPSSRASSLPQGLRCSVT